MTKRLIVLVLAIGLTACSMDKQAAPGLTGPSELGLSLVVTATPDIITQDGASQALVTVLARDANGQPVRGLSLRIDTFIGGTAVDYGTLGTRSISTGSDGRATVNYTAPPAPPPTVSADTMITVQVTPVGSNFANTFARAVDIKLMRPGVILPPNGTPVPKFFFTPTGPKEEERVFFDGSESTDSDGQIVSYTWNFGDGSGLASGVETSHVFSVSGEYTVSLTVKDDRGTTASTSKSVVVSASTNPTAAFTSSPTTPKVGGTVFLNAATSTVPPGRTITSYSWDFGDGKPGASGVSVNHVFDTAGTFTVTLTVTDSTGRKGVIAKTVAITP